MEISECLHLKKVRNMSEMTKWTSPQAASIVRHVVEKISKEI